MVGWNFENLNAERIIQAPSLLISMEIKCDDKCIFKLCVGASATFHIYHHYTLNKLFKQKYVISNTHMYLINKDYFNIMDIILNDTSVYLYYIKIKMLFSIIIFITILVSWYYCDKIKCIICKVWNDSRNF